MIMEVGEIVKKCGRPLARSFSIDLSEGHAAFAKWLLAALLYAKPMPEDVAIEAYNIMESHGYVDAASIAAARSDQLIKILQKSGFTRYDFSTASELHSAFRDLRNRYGGKLSRLYDESRDSPDLERRIQELGKGLGPAELAIFLLGMRDVWPKANPKPGKKVLELMSRLGIEDLENYAHEHDIDPGKLAIALCRYAREKAVRHRLDADRQWRERYRPARAK